MQGVFITKTVAGLGELEEIVKSHKNGVFLQQDKAYVRVMTQAQQKKYLQEERMRRSLMSTGFPLEWPQPETIIVLEELKSPGQAGAEAGSREWLMDWFRCRIRPASKKELTQQITQDPSEVYLEATSVFGDEYEGQLTLAPLKSFSVVGPDPAKKRSWYAELWWSEKNSAWTVR